MLIKVFLALIGLASGIAVSAGIFAFIMSLGVIERMADVTHTAKYIRLYETIVFLGAVSGNIFYIYRLNIHMGVIACAVFALLSGTFTGMVAIAIAEILNSIPIMMRRINIHKGLGFIVLSIALGKMVGAFLQFLHGWAT